MTGTARTAILEARHEILGGWFGRNFELHPTRGNAPDRIQPEPGERDIHGNVRGVDLDR